eukprot:4609187-Pyramimonas_sp.AAC.1
MALKSRIYRYGVQTKARRLMVCLKCTRANSSGRGAVARKCAMACDAIAQYTDQQHEHIIDQERFQDHIRMIQGRQLVLELREREQSSGFRFDDE